MNVFVINSGSSSIKYQLIRMPEATIICSGLIDRIGLTVPLFITKPFAMETNRAGKKIFQRAIMRRV